MQHPSLKDDFRHIIEEAEDLTLELNRSLDAYEDAQIGRSAQRELLELSLLLGSIRRSRFRAEELTKGMPSPNQVPASVAELVQSVGASLFAFIGSCHEREALIGRMAERVQNVV